MRQILIYFFLSLPILVMMTWLYLDKRSIKRRELKRIQLRSQPLAPEYLHILQTEFPLYLRFPR
jgi:hypothetical protein